MTFLKGKRKGSSNNRNAMWKTCYWLKILQASKLKRINSFRDIASEVCVSAVCLHCNALSNAFIAVVQHKSEWMGFLTELISRLIGGYRGRWCPCQEANLTPPFSNLRSFESQCTVLKNVRVTLLGSFAVTAIIRRPQRFAARKLRPLDPLLRPCWLSLAAAYIKLQMFTLANNLPLCDKYAFNMLD